MKRGTMREAVPETPSVMAYSFTCVRASSSKYGSFRAGLAKTSFAFVTS